MTYGNPSLFLVIVLIGWVIGTIPPYVVGSRTGVQHPGQAWIPIFGPYIVLLQSIKRSGWLCILVVIPIVELVFLIWLAFTIPSAHRRTAMWGLAFLIPVANLIAFYAYAFTLDSDRMTRPSSDGLASTYHVPPGGDWRP